MHELEIDVRSPDGSVERVVLAAPVADAGKSARSVDGDDKTA